MSLLLDTDTCSAYLKHRSRMQHRFVQHSGRLHISSIVLGELYTWAFRRASSVPALQAIRSELLLQVTVIHFDEHCAEEFGRERAGLLDRGMSVPTADLMIAATALAHNLTLVTHNTADYRHIPGLHLDDWLLP